MCRNPAIVYFVFILQVENIILFLINNVLLTCYDQRLITSRYLRVSVAQTGKKKILDHLYFLSGHLIKKKKPSTHLFGSLVAIRLTIFSAYWRLRRACLIGKDMQNHPQAYITCLLHPKDKMILFLASKDCLCYPFAVRGSTKDILCAVQFNVCFLFRT